MRDRFRKGSLKIDCFKTFLNGRPQSPSRPNSGQNNNKNEITVAAWYFITLLGRSDTADRLARRTALIAQELLRYKINIVTLSESRVAVEGCITEDLGGYTFSWKGYPHAQSCIHGVAFAIRSALLWFFSDILVGISPRLMKPLPEHR